VSTTPKSHLYKLDDLLQGGRAWTARELARRLGVSGRTVARYVDRLRREFRAPVESSRAGYRYASSFSLSPVRYSERDLFALEAARSVLEQYRGSFLTRQIEERIEELARRLVDRLPEGEIDLAQYLSFRISGTPSTELDALMDLLECALLRKEIEIRYRSPGAREATPRRVRPHGLTNRDGVWYLVAHDERRGKMVPFNVARIGGLRRTGREFERDPGFRLEDHFREAFSVMRGERRETVRIRFAPEKAHFTRERQFHPDQVLHERPDGGIDFEVTVDEPAELVPFVLGFGAGAEVLEPAWLRERVHEELSKAQTPYLEGDRASP